MSEELMVLLIDDDADLLEMSARRLKRKGCAVTTATCLSEAREHLSGSKYHSVVCDLFLASENGLTLYEELKKSGYPGEFVLATGDDSGDGRIANFRNEPRFSCLQKPFELQALLDIVARGKLA